MTFDISWHLKSSILGCGGAPGLLYVSAATIKSDCSLRHNFHHICKTGAAGKDLYASQETRYDPLQTKLTRAAVKTSLPYVMKVGLPNC